MSPRPIRCNISVRIRVRVHVRVEVAPIPLIYIPRIHHCHSHDREASFKAASGIEHRDERWEPLPLSGPLSIPPKRNGGDAGNGARPIRGHGCLADAAEQGGAEDEGLLRECLTEEGCARRAWRRRWPRVAAAG